MDAQLINWIIEKSCAFEFLYDVFRVRNYRVGSQDRKSGFLYVEKCMHYLTRVDRWKAFVPVTNVEQEIREARVTRIRAFKNGNDIRYLISLRVCVIRVQYFVIDLLRKKIESSKFFDIFDFEKKRKRKITNTNNGTTKLNKANNNLAYSNQFLDTNGYKF